MSTRQWEITYKIDGDNRRLLHYVEAPSQAYAAKIFDSSFPHLTRLGAPRPC